jgi:hypothetical protein
MLNQEDAALAVEHHRAHPKRGGAREPPIEMDRRPDHRLERAPQTPHSYSLAGLVHAPVFTDIASLGNGLLEGATKRAKPVLSRSQWL